MKKAIILSILILTLTNLLYSQTSWKGTTNTNWSTASNWTNGVPTTSIDAIIGDASFTGGNQPELDNNAVCKNLTLGNGSIVSSLSIKKNITVYGDLLIGANGTVNADNNNKTITLKGNWTNNGSYAATTSSALVTFSGTNQTLSGATTFEKVQLNSGSIVTITSNLTINSELKIYGEFKPNATVTVGGAGNLIVKDYGYLYVYAENFTDNYTISGTITLDKYSYVNYASSSITQYISNSFAYGRLRISGGSTKELTANLPNLQSSNSSTGIVYLDAGTLDLKTFTANRGNSSTGGQFIMATNTFLKIGGTNGFPSNYSYTSINSTSTVEYYGNNQTIEDLNYGNLIFSATSGSVVKTMPTTSLVIYGDFTSTIGTGTSLSFTAGSSIEVKKNIALGSVVTFNGDSYTHYFRGNWTNNGTYTGATSKCYLWGVNSTLSGTGANNFYDLYFYAANVTGSGTSTVNVYGNLYTSSGGTFTHNTGGTLTMYGNNKIISGSGLSLYNLTILDTTTTSNNIVIEGDLSCNGLFTCNSGTISLNGTSKSILGSGLVSFNLLNVNGTISTVSDFYLKSNLYVLSTGSFVASGGIASCIGFTTLTGDVSFYDLTVNAGKTFRLGTNSTTNVANVFTLNGNLHSTTYTPNYFKYDGAGNQSVVATTYYNLIMANGGTKTLAGNSSIRNDLTIDAGVTFDASSAALTIYKNWVNNGTFTPSTSNVQFTSTAISNIYGITTFNNLTINKSSSSTYTFLKDNVIANNIIMTQGILDTETDTITTLGGRTGNGIIYGTITHNHAFVNGTAYYFEGPYNSIKFTNPTASLTTVTVKITPDEVTDFDPTLESIEREYKIAIPAGAYTDATLRLHYEDVELSAFEEPFLAIYKHNTGIIWDSIGYTSRHTTQNWVEHTALTAITGRFTLSGVRKIVEWNGSVSDDWSDADNWTTVSGSDMSNRVPGSNDAAYIGFTAFTNQPTVYANENVAVLRLGSTQSVNITLNSPLSIVSSVKGVWSASQTHTINVGSSQFDIGSNLHLSDGTAGNIININAVDGTINVENNLLQKATSSIAFSDAGNLTINGNYNYVSGTFTPATSTVTYSGPISQVVAPFTYYNLAFTKANEKALINYPALVNGNLETSIGGEVEINDTLAVVGNITIGASSTLMENNGKIFLQGNWVNNGTFTPSTGLVCFNGTSAQTVNSTGFNDLDVNKSSGTLSLTGSISINDELSLTQGTLDLVTYSADRISNGGKLTLASGTTLKVGGTDNFPNYYAVKLIDAASEVDYNGTIAQNVLTEITYGNLTFSNGTTNAKSLLGNIQVNGNLLINAGATILLDSINISLYGNITNNGTITPGQSTLKLEGTTKTMVGPFTLNNIITNGSYTVTSGTTSLAGNLYVETTGSLNFGNNDVILDGDLTNKGSLTSNANATFTGTRVQTLQLLNAVTSSSTGVINFNGTVAPILNSTSSPNFATVNINNTAGITPSSSWNVFVACNIANGSSFNDGGFTHNFYRNFTNNGTVVSSGNLRFTPGAPFSASGTITLDGTSFTSTGNVTFAGTAPITIIDNNPSFTNVFVTNTHSSGVTAPSSWNIANKFQISNGSLFNAGTATSHVISENLVNNGTLNGETSTITFNGVGVLINGTGSTTFNNLTIGAGANLTLNKSINITKNLVNDGVLNGLGRTVAFTGSTASVISGVTGNITFGELEQNKTSTTTTLSIPVTVIDNLYMNNGVILSDNTNLLILNNDATSSSGNSTSFVNGPMKKIGDDAFIFPLGDGAKWARLGISAPSVTTDAFTAQYYDTNYVDTTTMALAPAPVLNKVSKNEYWTCDRTNGSSNVTVQLFWENNVESGINAYTADLVVAHWNGSAWENAGQSSINTSNPGSVTSNTVNSFSPFTFGSLSPATNPLPIELLNFNATLADNIIDLKWETATEINNEFFIVEKSTDATNFEFVDRIVGAGNSNINLIYHTKDLNPIKGISYYRLKQVDFDGKQSYSSIVSVNYSPNVLDFNVYPNPNDGEVINISFTNDSKPYQIRIIDTKGYEIYSEKIWGSNNYKITPANKLKSGLYIISLIGEKETISQKLIIK